MKIFNISRLPEDLASVRRNYYYYCVRQETVLKALKLECIFSEKQSKRWTKHATR